MATSLATIESTVLGILREEDFSSAYPKVLIDLFANSAQQDILAGRLIHPITKEETQAGDLHFLNSDVYYSNIQGTYTTIDALVGDTVLNVSDTTEYPTTGSLFIWGQCVDYTGKTATSFTGVTPLLFAFVAGTMVSVAFKLPDDFSDIKNVVYNNKIKIPAKQYDDMFEDLNNYKGSNFQRNKTTSIYESPYKVKPFYTTKDSKYLIIFQLNETGESIHLRYQKLAPLMTSTQDSIIDNDLYAQSCISYLTVAELLRNRGEEVRASAIYSLAISRVKKMYDWYNDGTYESQNWVQYSTGKGKLNI
jgi:hypothetical protein